MRRSGRKGRRLRGLETVLATRNTCMRFLKESRGPISDRKECKERNTRG